MGYGFRLTAPASTTPQRLTFWVSAHHGTGRLTATVGGASQVDTGVIGGQNNGGVYTIDFASDGIEEFLEVTYVLDSVSPSPDDFGLPSTEANVVVYAAALSPTGPATVAAPALYQAIPAAGNQALISGRLSANASSDYAITIKTAATCDEGVLGEGGSTLGSFTTTTDDVGDSYFSELVPNGSDLDTYVTAEVTGPGGVTSSPSTCIVRRPDNDTWPRALEIGPGTVAGSTVTGYIDDAGRARWYKVPIDPGSRVHVNCQIFPLTTTSSSSRTSFRPSRRWRRPKTSPVSARSSRHRRSALRIQPLGLLAFGFLTHRPSRRPPSARRPSRRRPSRRQPSARQPSAPSAFSPSAFSPVGLLAVGLFSHRPSRRPPSARRPSRRLRLVRRPMPAPRSGALSPALPGWAPRPTVVADTWNNTGHFYIRVSGKNGKSNLDAPFTLGVTLDGSVCDNVSAQTLDDVDAPAGSFKTLVLTDMARMPSSVAGNSTADKAALTADSETFAERAEIAGDVVDVGRAGPGAQCAGGRPQVLHVRQEPRRHRHPGRRRPRTVSPIQVCSTWSSWVATALFRSSGTPTRTCSGQNATSGAGHSGIASDASLRANFVLGQHVRLVERSSLPRSAFPNSELPVGRLVETAAEASGMIDAYLATTNGVIATPTTSLVTGYDFFRDGAD